MHCLIFINHCTVPSNVSHFDATVWQDLHSIFIPLSCDFVIRHLTLEQSLFSSPDCQISDVLQYLQLFFWTRDWKAQESGSGRRQESESDSRVRGSIKLMMVTSWHPLPWVVSLFVRTGVKPLGQQLNSAASSALSCIRLNDSKPRLNIVSVHKIPYSGYTDKTNTLF